MVGMGTAVLRLLLLALLTVGVVGMHTVGHASEHHTWMASADERVHLAAGAAPPDGSAARVVDAADTCGPGCGMAGPVPAHPGSGSHPAPGSTGLIITCLAVLCGLGVLALLASGLARRRATGSVGAGHRRARIPRIPPTPIPGFALRLVEVTVLRR